ncbi:DNA primase, partial [Bacteroides sp. OttesenSCG-928-F21]|nr:DNA primase [Bacteroides sp. OttesenSCG-928-F21]
SVPDSAYESFIPQGEKEGKEFYQFERLILQMVVRYGEKHVCDAEGKNGETIGLSVIEYIENDLKADDLAFHNPLHRKIFEEGVKQVKNSGFKAERFFISHPDPVIAKMCAELASERYQLSKYHTKNQEIPSEERRSYEITTMLLLNFKSAIVKEELKYIMKKLQDPATYNDVEKCNSIQSRYKELHNVLRALEKQEGDRVIIPF